MISVLEQTYPDIEYIIVDGKSSDGTLNVIQQVAKRYPDRQIKILSEPDKGIADAMNKGILLAHGEIIAHLHAGDRYIDEHVIEKVVESYKRNGWRWAVAGSIVVDFSGNQRHVYKAHPDYRILIKKNCIPHQSTFLVRDIFEKHGLFRVDYKQAMDYEYWLRIAFFGKERYHLLPFVATYFLEGGRSSRILELLYYLALARRELRSWVDGLTWFDDLIFFARVVAFHTYLTMKGAFSSLLRRACMLIDYFTGPRRRSRQRHW
jgi:glycosyltransferase